MRAPEQRFETVAGYRTHFVVAGDGPPILLVHGVGSSHLTYQRNIEELAVIGRVYALDLPGHGLSEVVDGDYLAERGGAFLCSFIEEIIGEPAALVGVSAGGLMGIIAASERPDLVSRLVLVSSAGFGREVSWMLRLLTLPFVERFADVASPEQVRAALRRQVYDPSTIGADFVNAEYENWRRPGNRHAFLNALRCNITLLGVRRWRRHLRRASRLALPVLIIWGKNDRTIGVKYAYRAAKRIAGARLTVLDRCGHLAPYERPAEFNRLVREFLD